MPDTMGAMMARRPSVPALSSARSWSRIMWGAGQREPDAPEAQERVELLADLDSGNLLVPSHIEGADHHEMVPEGAQHRPVGLVLLLLGDRTGSVEEQELGPEQAHSLGARFHGPGGIGVRADVGRHLDPGAVPGQGRLPRPVRGARPGSPLLLLALPERPDHGLGGINVDLAGLTVQGDQRSGLGGRQVDPHHRRKPHPPGEDRDVGGGAPFLRAEAEGHPRRDGGRLRGEEILRDQHRRDFQGLPGLEG